MYKPTKYEFPKERIPFDKNIEDKVNIPESTLGVLTTSDAWKDLPKKLIQPLKGMRKRDWMDDHAYFCLPLSMGNQHGFIVKAAYDFSVFWNGGNHPSDVYVRYWVGQDELKNQSVQPHFGMGTVTIQNNWVFRTPKGVNLLVMNPPNFYVDGLIHMTAIVETDQLRRDFTFNLKITRPNEWIFIKKDTPIGCVLPYPRHFIDNYKLKVDEEVVSREILEDERKTAVLFGQERAQIDSKYAGCVGLRYMNGEDVYNNKFKDHQRALGQKGSSCPFGFKKEITPDTLDVDAQSD